MKNAHNMGPILELLENADVKDIAIRSTNGKGWMSTDYHYAKNIEGEWGLLLAPSYFASWSLVQACDALDLIPSDIEKIALLWREYEQSALDVERLSEMGICVLGDIACNDWDLARNSGQAEFSTEYGIYLVNGTGNVSDNEAAATNLATLSEELSSFGYIAFPVEPTTPTFSDAVEALKFATGLLGIDLPDLSSIDQSIYSQWLPPKTRFFYYKGNPGTIAWKLSALRCDTTSAMRLWSVLEDILGLFFSDFSSSTFDSRIALDIVSRCGIDSELARMCLDSPDITDAVRKIVQQRSTIPLLTPLKDPLFSNSAPETEVARLLHDIIMKSGAKDCEYQLMKWGDRRKPPTVEHFIFPFDDIIDKDDISGEWAVMFASRSNIDEPGVWELVAMMATGELPVSVTKGIVIVFDERESHLSDAFLVQACEDLLAAGVFYVRDFTTCGMCTEKDGTPHLIDIDEPYDYGFHLIRHPELVLSEVKEGMSKMVFDYLIIDLLWNNSLGITPEIISREGLQALSFGKIDIPENLAQELPILGGSESGYFEPLGRMLSPCYDFDFAPWESVVKTTCNIFCIWEELLDQGASLICSNCFPSGVPHDVLSYLNEQLGIEPAIKAYLSGVSLEDIINFE